MSFRQPKFEPRHIATAIFFFWFSARHVSQLNANRITKFLAPRTSGAKIVSSPYPFIWYQCACGSRACPILLRSLQRVCSACVLSVRLSKAIFVRRREHLLHQLLLSTFFAPTLCREGKRRFTYRFWGAFEPVLIPFLILTGRGHFGVQNE